MNFGTREIQGWHKTLDQLNWNVYSEKKLVKRASLQLSKHRGGL